MKTRIISGAVLTALTLIMFIVGGNLLFIITFLLSILGLYELYKAFNTERSIFAITGYIMTFVFYLSIFLSEITLMNIPLFLIILLSLIVMGILYVFSFPDYSIKNLITCFFAFIYVSISFSIIYLTRNLFFGAWYVWIIIISSWISDTCAYFVGMRFGKSKLSPILSPKKSREGAVGGLLGALVVGVIYGIIMMINLKKSFGFVLVVGIICVIGSLISIIGDLFASGIKREMGIKDYGNLIPGHGGILDRFDSVLFVAPIIYVLCKVLI